MDISALLQRVRTRLQGEVQYTQYTAPSTATSRLKLNFSTNRINDPEAEEVTVTEGLSVPFTSVKIDKGETIKLIPLTWYKNSVSYRTKKEYISSSTIDFLKLRDKFSDLSSANVVVKDSFLTGEPIAEGFITPSWRPEWMSESVSRFKYLWLRTQRTVNETRIDSGTYDLRRTLEEFKALEISFAFTGINYNRKFSPIEILEEKQNWTASYNDNEGVLTLTARRDLETLGLYPRFDNDEEKKRREKKERQKKRQEELTEEARAKLEEQRNQEAQSKNEQLQIKKQLEENACRMQSGLKVQSQAGNNKTSDASSTNQNNELKNSPTGETNSSNIQCRKECSFDMPMTKQKLSQCNNIPTLVVDSILQVRVDLLTGELKPELEYIVQSDDSPMKTKRAIILSIKRPEFVTEK